MPLLCCCATIAAATVVAVVLATAAAVVAAPCFRVGRDMNTQDRHAVCIGFYGISNTRSACGIGSLW